MTINGGIPAGGGNRSNTGYIGSFQHALANDAGHHADMRRLAQHAANAADDAFVQGQHQGFAEGHAAGRAEAIQEANIQLSEQLAYTREHVADKERLKAELARQAQVIDALEARVKAMEAENAALRKENGLLRSADTGLRDLIGSLRAANQNLQDQVTQLDADFKKRTQEYIDQVWQYNRTMIYVSTVGSVLEELTRDNTPQAQHARELFVEKYAEEVDRGLRKGTIKMAPDIDPAFDRYLPKTRQFIADLLVMAKAGQEDTLAAEP